MGDMNPFVEDFYKDNKGRLYQVRGNARDSKTGQRVVIYQALFDTYDILVTDNDSFFAMMESASVSQNKYFISKSDNLSAETQDLAMADEDTISDLMMSFFDENNFEKKDEILSLIRVRPELDDNIIDNLAASIDVVIDSGDIDKRFRELRTCVRTRARFEGTRLR